MDNKEIIDLFMQQIEDRNKIIDSLLSERRLLVKTSRADTFKDFMPYIVMVIWIIFYFCTNW